MGSDIFKTIEAAKEGDRQKIINEYLSAYDQPDKEQVADCLEEFVISLEQIEV